MASRESSSKSRSGKPLHSVDLPVFVISVAAELAGMHPQTCASTTVSAWFSLRVRPVRRAAIRSVT